jgi:hypothetical protein
MEWLLAIRLGHYVVGVGSRDLEASLPGEWMALVVSFFLFAALAGAVLFVTRRTHARVGGRGAVRGVPVGDAPDSIADLFTDGSAAVGDSGGAVAAASAEDTTAKGTTAEGAAAEDRTTRGKAAQGAAAPDTPAENVPVTAGKAAATAESAADLADPAGPVSPGPGTARPAVARSASRRPRRRRAQ